MVERTPGPFEYYPDLHPGVTGDSIRADAEDPGLDAKTIQALSDELEGDSRSVAADLSGAITAEVQKNPDELSGQARTLAANGFYAVGLINRFAGQVDTFDTTVNGLNHRYRTDLAMAMRWAGQAAASTEDKDDDKLVTEAHMGPQIKKNLQPEYDKALDKLDTDADAIASDFRAGLDNKRVRELIRQGLIPLDAAVLYAGLELTPADKQAYYTSVLGAMTKQEQIDWVKAHKDGLPPEAAAAIRPEVQEYFAGQIATAIKDLETIDADTVAYMTFFQDQDAFATELYTSVTPDEMGEAIKQLNYQIFGVGNPDTDYSGRSFDGPPDLEVYNGFLNAAGVALATYSRSVDDPAALADDWFDAITDGDNPENAAALTLLVREGGEQPDGKFDATFIDRLTSQVVDWERDQDGPVWGPRAQDAGVWIRDPDKVDITEWTDAYGNSKYTVAGGVATDGLANLLGGMAHSPEGAQRFFTDADGNVDEDRLKYLMLHRTFSESDFSDEGDGLGEALQAATIGGVEGKHGDYTDKEAAALATDVFQIIADNSGTDDKDDLGTDDAGGPLDGDMDNEWHVWADMTDSLGAIGAGYADDIYAELGPGTGSGSGPRLDVDETDLLRVIGEIGHTDDKTGLETLLAGVAHAGIEHEVGDKLDTFRTGDGPFDMATFKQSGINLNTGAIGEVLGTMINASDDVYTDEQMAEQTRRAYAAKAFEFGTSFLPGAGKLLSGVPAAVETTLDFGKGELISQMQDAISKVPEAESGDYRTDVRASLQYAVANEFLQHDLLGEQPDPGDATGVYGGVPDSITQQSPTGEAVFDPDLWMDRTEEESPDWDRWVDSNPYSDIMDQTREATNELDAILNVELAHGATQG
ncbi:MAG TPA: hypothetical protein VFO98_07525 [Marmoricola sp.]|nr:hypothetical protein [Marmoricola sp.]